jgi:hypothetical protein
MRLPVKKRIWNGNPPPAAPIGNGYALKHGFQPLKAAVNKLGSRTRDKRTALGRSLAKWHADLIADLGGPDNISTQQSTLVDLTVKSKLLLDSIDAWHSHSEP